MKKIILILILSYFIFAAREASAFGLSPGRTLLTMDPGANQVLRLKIKNDEPGDLVLHLKVMGVKQSDDDRLTYAPGLYEAENWVMPEVNNTNIKSGEEKTVGFEINVPISATPGSSYLALSAETALDDEQGTTNLRTVVVSLLTLQISGTVKEKLEIAKWSLESYSLTKADWPFALLLKNDSPVEVMMAGKVTARSWLGGEALSRDLDLGGKFLARAARARAVAVELGSGLHLPGKYTIEVKINYGKTKQVVSAAVEVWYFPIWSMVVFGLLVLLAIGLMAGRKKR